MLTAQLSRTTSIVNHGDSFSNTLSLSPRGKFRGRISSMRQKRDFWIHFDNPPATTGEIMPKTVDVEFSEIQSTKSRNVSSSKMKYRLQRDVLRISFLDVDSSATCLLSYSRRDSSSWPIFWGGLLSAYWRVAYVRMYSRATKNHALNKHERRYHGMNLKSV